MMNKRKLALKVGLGCSSMGDYSHAAIQLYTWLVSEITFNGKLIFVTSTKQQRFFWPEN